ncbi:gamma carbonic anhydrase family protein [Chitinasiproducens palmae]|uniref:Carbonic anhydrase or acetyltransferase, isoleucine patch superfamily n=1 Tax=Chitinasiproducens palmae TaxID=1770053 RepID=A0A1H2PR13_9BURK|nr:gamma carbonic anhydrase family protein [Chitinasiproducens palmae]SDV49296.1 Carbonic anhydrase or acetyltransferase, isoleucine patch superfamily [Chitinasiproducens palmae]
MTIYAIGDIQPSIDPTAYVAAEATVIGNIALAAEASVWPQAVLRGDNDLISVGRRSNVQDGAVLHTDDGTPLTLGEGVTIGHQAMLHGCTIGDNTLIGIQAVVLNRAVIGENSLVGAGALVTEGKQFPPGSLILGTPARVARALTEAEIAGLRHSADGYVARGALFRDQLRAIG